RNDVERREVRSGESFSPGKENVPQPCEQKQSKADRRSAHGYRKPRHRATGLRPAGTYRAMRPYSPWGRLVEALRGTAGSERSHRPELRIGPLTPAVPLPAFCLLSALELARFHCCGVKTRPLS